VLEFPFRRHLSLFGSCPLDLSHLGDPTASSATADLALGGYWNLQAPPPQQGGIAIGGAWHCCIVVLSLVACYSVFNSSLFFS
jgi:hypothetical protein